VHLVGFYYKNTLPAYSTFSVADEGTREKKCNAALNGSIYALV